MKKIVIIGGGFAGLSAAQALFSQRRQVEVILIDKKLNFNFLPLLPDTIGRKISTDFMTYSINDLSKRYRFRFINGDVYTLDLKQNKVFTSRQELFYDYLLIASGSETNFYGDNIAMKSAYKLDDIEDVKKICLGIEKGSFNCYLIIGGGYTGIEIATNLRARLNGKSRHEKIVIIERAASILGPLPEWMKAYVGNNLKMMEIEVLLNTSIKKIESRDIYLSNGLTFKNAMLIWSAGVKAANFIDDLKVEKNPQGRIKVDEYLRLNEDCFVAGDAAHFPYKKSFLRMGIQFSIIEGRCAANNIIRSIGGKRLHKYRPIDLGYIVPMANNKSCGGVLGLKIKGFLATFFHYIMCIYRSYSFRCKLGITRSLITGGGKK
ncbi:MAG: FAD-dependent oxidoreductase [Candidatus Omnitrophota bacterium]